MIKFSRSNSETAVPEQPECPDMHAAEPPPGREGVDLHLELDDDSKGKAGSPQGGFKQIVSRHGIKTVGALAITLLLVLQSLNLSTSSSQQTGQETPSMEAYLSCGPLYIMKETLGDITNDSNLKKQLCSSLLQAFLQELQTASSGSRSVVLPPLVLPLSQMSSPELELYSKTSHLALQTMMSLAPTPVSH